MPRRNLDDATSTDGPTPALSVKADAADNSIIFNSASATQPPAWLSGGDKPWDSARCTFALHDSVSTICVNHSP